MKEKREESEVSDDATRAFYCKDTSRRRAKRTSFDNQAEKRKEEDGSSQRRAQIEEERTEKDSLRRGHQFREPFRPRLSIEIEHILVVVRSFVEILGLPRVEHTAKKKVSSPKVSDAI